MVSVCGNANLLYFELGYLNEVASTCAGFVAFLVGFGAVCVGYALSLDYSAKLFVMTFVLVVMGSNEPGGTDLPTESLSCIPGGITITMKRAIFYQEDGMDQQVGHIAAWRVC